MSARVREVKNKNGIERLIGSTDAYGYQFSIDKAPYRMRNPLNIPFRGLGKKLQNKRNEKRAFHLEKFENILRRVKIQIGAPIGALPKKGKNLSFYRSSKNRFITVNVSEQGIYP